MVRTPSEQGSARRVCPAIWVLSCCNHGNVSIERRTYAQQAYSDVRRLIIDGTLPMGSKLIVRELEERLRLSATPIKSALAALERDGFLVTESHRGYYVPTVTIDDMRDIYDLREVLDGKAALRLAGRPDRSEAVAELRSLLEQQRERAVSGDTAAYTEVDVEFHRQLWHAAGNNRLARVADNLIGQLRFGTASSSTVPGRMPCAVEEHEAILDAVDDGDGVRAEYLAREHVRRSAEAFLLTLADEVEFAEVDESHQ